MNTRTNFILTYVAGIITGAILALASVLAYSIYASSENASKTTSQNVSKESSKKSANPDIEWFNNPGQEINVKALKVWQVLPDGCAMARVQADIDDLLENDRNSMDGTKVLLPATKETVYFDGQIVTRPEGKHFRLTGTYRHKETMETIPVIELFDK